MGKSSEPAAMLGIAEIADRDDVSRPSVSGIVKRLVEQFGLVVERDGRGRVARVNVAQYDRLRDRPGANGRAPSDAARVIATETVKNRDFADPYLDGGMLGADPAGYGFGAAIVHAPSLPGAFKPPANQARPSQACWTAGRRKG